MVSRRVNGAAPDDAEAEALHCRRRGSGQRQRLRRTLLYVQYVMIIVLFLTEVAVYRVRVWVARQHGFDAGIYRNRAPAARRSVGQWRLVSSEQLLGSFGWLCGRIGHCSGGQDWRLFGCG